MTKLLLAAIFVFSTVFIGAPPVAVAQKGDFVRTSVQGFGKTRFEAEADARRNANSVSTSYRTISISSRQSGTQWVCTLVIEYKRR